jgi:uncharacterized membrane protein YfcA
VLGVAVGAFGTLVGAGGGFVLVPVLLLLYPDKSANTITAMSLLVVLANASSGTLAYSFQKRVDYVSGGWFALSTVPGAIAGAIVVGYIPRRAFDALFAAVVMIIGAYLFLRPQRTGIIEPAQGRGIAHRMLTDSSGQTFAYAYPVWKGIAISVAVGFMSSLLGIGGGIIHVPAMATILHFPVHIAAATSHFVIVFVTAEGTAVHFSTGTLGWDRSLAEAGLIALGAVLGAQAGARLGRHLHGQAIIRVLASALLLVAVRLVLEAFST